MNAQINNLYKLNAEEGGLSWQDCNEINHELAGMSLLDIPEHQVSNVANYLCSILTWESAFHCDRIGLEQL